MYRIIALAIKDIVLLTRNYASLFWIFIFPLLLALFFGVTFGDSGREKQGSILVGIVDNDKSEGSQKFIDRLSKTKALKLQNRNLADARDAVRRGSLVAFVVIPNGFGDPRAMFSPNAKAIQIGIDPARQATAGYLQGLVTQAYFSGLQDQFSNPNQFGEQLPKVLDDIDNAKDMKPEDRKSLKDFLTKMKSAMDVANPKMLMQSGPFQGDKIETVSVTREGARPQSSFEITFPSSILWGILGCVQAFVISIVGERVAGTLLRLRIAPLSWSQILAGKALTCFLVVLFVSAVMLVLGWLLFGVRLNRPIPLGMAIVSTAICFVGLMMLLATLGKTVEGVAGAAWGIMLPLAMIGGGMIPLMIMPDWMFQISSISPVKWGILALEGAIWRDYSLTEMLLPCGILIAVGTVCFLVGAKRLSWGE